MYKRKTRLAARLLSIVLAAGMSVSGVSVSALAAEVSEEPAQQETVVTQEAAEEPEAAPAAEEENEEVTEADVPAEPKDEAEAKVPVQGAEEESIHLRKRAFTQMNTEIFTIIWMGSPYAAIHSVSMMRRTE